MNKKKLYDKLLVYLKIHIFLGALSLEKVRKNHI